MNNLFKNIKNFLLIVFFNVILITNLNPKEVPDSFADLVERLMPNAEVIADRFHVMKQINDELDSERKKEIREATEIKNKEEREKKVRWSEEE